MSTLLEQARIAQRTIDEERFYFPSWKHCTCGHIYHAATGYWSEEGAVPHGATRHEDDDRAYTALLNAVMEANKIILGATVSGRAHAAMRVSQYTRMLGDRTTHARPGAYRMAAREMLDKTVAMLEARERATLAEIEKFIEMTLPETVTS